MEIHSTWLELRPRFESQERREPFEKYHARINSIAHLKEIPMEVLRYWLWEHTYERHNIANYGWIDYRNVVFEHCQWGVNPLCKVTAIKDFRPYFTNRSSYTDFDQFSCISKDLLHWKEKGTWRIPPVILDVNSIGLPRPTWSELTPPFQLVEGHSRLGYLNSMKTIHDLGKGTIANNHWIYLMKMRIS